MQAQKRKEFLIDELFRLDPIIYLRKPLYDYSLAELEYMYITEKCKPEHVFAYLHGVAR